MPGRTHCDEKELIPAAGLSPFRFHVFIIFDQRNMEWLVYNYFLLL